MGKRKLKTIRAGRQVRQIIYPVLSSSDSQQVRSAKKRASTSAQSMLNRRHSFEKCQDLIAENFDVTDYVITLTYADHHYPCSRKAAEARVKKLVASLRKYWRSQHWHDPVILWVTEEKHGDGRLHHHLIIKSPPGRYFKALQAFWPYGGMDAKKLRVDKEKNYESIARYLCKEAPDVGKHQWHITRSASRPDVTVCWVSGDAQIRPPKGSLILNYATVHDYQFGSGYQYAAYIIPVEKKHKKRKI